VGPRGIPREVRRFIAQHISSVAQLEVLLLVRAAAGKPHTAETVGQALRIDPGWAEAELARLRGDGFLIGAEDVPGAYCYSPASTRLRSEVDALAEAFSTHRVSVITLIFSPPSDAIDSFADAFKFRKDDDG
jgi:hypothetical protein